MSTKIYNGLIFKDQTLNDVYQNLMKIKPSAKQHAQRNVLKNMCRLAANVMDEVTTANHSEGFTTERYYQEKAEWDRGDWCMHWHRQFREARKSDTREYMDIDFVFEIALFPHNNDVLAYWISESGAKEILDELASIGAEDYHYQNGTDKPEEISEDEWEVRCKAWRCVLPTAPIDTGLIFSLVTWDDLRGSLYDLFKDPELWPTEEERKKAVAKNIALFQVDNLPEYKDLSLFEKLDKSKEIFKSLIPNVVLCDLSCFNEKSSNE